MAKKDLERKFAFVVPSLNEISAQNEDIVQLLIFAALKLEQELTKTERKFSATIISIEHDTSGWKHLSTLFSNEVLNHISVEMLEEAITPNMAIGNHKPAYNLYEYLKKHLFDEVHCLDYGGMAYYPTQAKQLGLYFLKTIFSIHVVGATVFRENAKDSILDDVGWLMHDLLERGSIERADVIYIHDRKAWHWYSDKIDNLCANDDRVYDISWANKKHRAIKSEAIEDDATFPIIFYGSLGADGGLSLFCDVIDRALSKIERPVEVFFIGSPQPMSGMDAVSYIRVRSEKWKLPITIKRDLSISDEITLLYKLDGLIYCDRVRRENLRLRLIANSSLQVLQIIDGQIAPRKQANKLCSPNPSKIAQILINIVTNKTARYSRQTSELPELWRIGRPNLANIEDIAPMPPLKLKSSNEPKVSVCVTHYCRPEKLRRALASLGQQTYKNFEVIVVDDGSPEPEIQKELAKIKREIEPLGWRLLVQENRYLGATRNFAAQHATGDYLIFMDDDNIAKPGEIKIFVAVAQRTNAEIVTAFCDVFQDDSEAENGQPPKMRFTPFGSDIAIGVFSNCYGDANALYSRKIFVKLGGFTEDYGITHEDWEFFARASLEGVKMICIPEPLFWYRLDSKGMFRGLQTQLHKSANLNRHLRPYLEKLPYFQAKLVQLVQGLIATSSAAKGKTPILEIPAIVSLNTRTAAPKLLKTNNNRLPYARVAIIMRTKDRPLMLQRAIRSVLNQTFKDWLLVIINDGGNPETAELVVERFAEELKGNVLLLHNPVSLGMQTASNAGISSCESDFIVVHDDDDTWKPTFLARTVSYLDNQGWNPRIAGVVTWSDVIIEEFSEDGKTKVLNRFIFNDKMQDISILDLTVENRFPPIAFLFCRAALDEVGPFNERYNVLGDWEFVLRLLRRYEIEVIPESLANYHHRPKTTDGAYGNSVHAQNQLHISKRIQLLNDALRDGFDKENSFSLAHLLALGNLQKNLLSEQSREFQRLHDYIWTIEQTLKHKGICSQGYCGHNLVRNGDFRLWQGPGKTIRKRCEKYAYQEICPGYLISYNGKKVSYKAEQRKWREDGKRLPLGKTYLHIESAGKTKGETWFILECILPSVLLLSGKNICISGMCRLKSQQDFIFIGGRHILGSGKEFTWTDKRSSIASELQHWSCSIFCPSVEETEISNGHNSRIFLKLPHDKAFEFDLTNFQVEIGTQPTKFVYL